MKKNVFLSMALLSAAVAVGSTPLNSYAAQARSVQCVTGKGYQVYIGQGMGSLSQIMKELCPSLGNIGNLCPETDKPEENAPQIPVPETPAPELPEIPDNGPAPEVPETPDNGTSGENKPLSYAEQVVKLVNEERTKAGLSPLIMDEDLTSAANVRAKEIKQKFSHTRPDGSSFSTVLTDQGIRFRGSGENIAWGQKSPEQVMNDWMNSDGHRANILNKNFKNIGVGYYQDEMGTRHWVQLFTY